MSRLRKVDNEIMRELVKNPRQSDREVARILKVSQPTVTRRRQLIEKEGLLDYTAIPDLKKLGFEILAFTFGQRKFDKYPDIRVEAARQFVEKHPNIIFVSGGSGNCGDRIAISVHRNYAEYADFMQDVRSQWEPIIGAPTTFMVSLQSEDVLRHATFRHLMSLLSRKEPP